jgi:hypothetical protein
MRPTPQPTSSTLCSGTGGLEVAAPDEAQAAWWRQRIAKADRAFGNVQRPV